MIYTIGKTKIYEDYMERDPLTASKGVTGSVWETFVQAKMYRDRQASGWSVYGVEADWLKDTKDIGEDFRSLTKDCKLVAVDQKTGESI